MVAMGTMLTITLLCFQLLSKTFYVIYFLFFVVVNQALGFDDHHGSDEDGAHSHVSSADGDHSHDDSGYGDLMLVWRTCAVVGGMYFFYVMEYILNWLTGGHHHSHGFKQVS